MFNYYNKDSFEFVESSPYEDAKLNSQYDYTTVPLPTQQLKRKKLFFDVPNQKWLIYNDYTGMQMWDVNTGTLVVVSSFTKTHDTDYTTFTRPNPYSIWNSDTKQWCNQLCYGYRKSDYKYTGIYFKIYDYDTKTFRNPSNTTDIQIPDSDLENNYFYFFDINTSSWVSHLDKRGVYFNKQSGESLNVTTLDTDVDLTAYTSIAKPYGNYVWSEQLQNWFSEEQTNKLIQKRRDQVDTLTDKIFSRGMLITVENKTYRVPMNKENQDNYKQLFELAESNFLPYPVFVKIYNYNNGIDGLDELVQMDHDKMQSLYSQGINFVYNTLNNGFTFKLGGTYKNIVYKRFEDYTYDELLNFVDPRVEDLI